MVARFSLIVSVFTLSLLSAQNARPGALVATGYRLPTSLITAAPGQLSMISVSGIEAKPGLPVKAEYGPTGYPSEIKGLRLRVRSSSGASIDTQLAGLQQSGCAATDIPCLPITSFTVVFPEDLPSGLTGTLIVSDNTAIIAEFPFRAVSDNLHLLNSCDTTLIWASIFAIAPDASVCQPNIIQNSRLVQANNPIQPGGGVAAYLYGGGATVLRNDEFQRKETVQDFDVHFDYRANAPGSRPVPGVSLIGKPFLSVGFGGGLYQVNFMIPPVPPGIQLPRCDGTTTRSNLTITISGANSIDSASFCVEPQ